MSDAFCTKCRAKLADGEVFCRSCGSQCDLPHVAVDNKEYDWVSEARNAREQEAATKQEIARLTEEYRESHDDALAAKIRRLNWELHKPAADAKTKCSLPKQSILAQSIDKRTWLIVKASVGVVILLLVIKACSGPPAPSDHADLEAMTAIRVKSQCEDYVKKYLKSPSTAEFSGLADTTVYDKGNKKYTVIGWVDSQNSFGAKLRTKYACTTTDEGSGQWSFEPLVTNDGSE